VGHELDPHAPTHFTALNLRGQVVIFEVPGGDSQHARLLQGPHLVGPGADLAPLLLTFSGDARHPDLVVTVNGLQVMFRNTGRRYESMQEKTKGILVTMATIHLAMMIVPFSRGMAMEKWYPVATFRKSTICRVRSSGFESCCSSFCCNGMGSDPFEQVSVLTARCRPSHVR
jgi:hypothetical protein